ncbi:YqcC family protein [Pectobacterium polonicum]|uniref:YqcC family protein n=1 Tax=Pectobacterium polonicum TaxID=2485124 RepID=A0AAE9NU94_9GAMM|nr:YqcC family protein [Pectobacterium polonicum]UVO09392.1 YqcC family protein [Pectobacterium polonicum]
MSRESQVRQSLFDIERVLRESPFWQVVPPEDEAFNSTEPFSLDTMRPEEWLQWVFLPRMHALLDSDLALPAELALLPYFEDALEGTPEQTAAVFLRLKQLDELFNPDVQDGAVHDA